jgi:hypothetical protein
VSDDERPRLREALDRIDALVSVLGRVADAGARDAARELLELVLDLHGLALVRAMAIVTSAGGGKELAERLARDEQVRAVLLLHGLHPEPFEERVRKAVECLRPELESLGCRMRLVEVRAATAWLRIEGVLRLEAPRTLSLRRQIEAALIERGCDGLSTHPRPNNVNSAERHFSPDIRI